MAEEKKPQWYQNKVKYINEYNKQNIKRYELKVNKKLEADLFEHMEKIPNKSEYLKTLVLNDMNKNK